MKRVGMLLLTRMQHDDVAILVLVVGGHMQYYGYSEIIFPFSVNAGIFMHWELC
jgi:hypothetical protein